MANLKFWNQYVCLPMSGSRILKILERYRLKNSRVPIIVEGRHDIDSLRRIDFPGEIITINSGSSLVTFSDNIARNYSEVILLPDFDRKGHQIMSNLENFLHGSGCFVDTDLWNSIRKMMPVRTVEELPFALGRVQQTEN